MIIIPPLTLLIKIRSEIIKPQQDIFTNLHAVKI